MSIVSNSLQITANQESGNRYWEGGAFCTTCGYLQGNVINDTIHSIYHLGCQPDCQEVWESQGEYQTNNIQSTIERYIENKINIVPDSMTKEDERWYQQELLQDLYEESTGYLRLDPAAKEYKQQCRETESMGLEEERKRQEDREWDELEIEEALQEEEEWKQRELFREEYERDESRYDIYESEDYDREDYARGYY